MAKIVDEAQRVGNRTDPDYGFLHSDFNGTYLNIQNGYRKTTGNAVSPKRRVWFFGGSTVLCSEVPDHLTLPSLFARFANAKFGDSLGIVNAGATTVTIRHQAYRLKTATDIRKGDLIIFLDGVNDVIQTLYYQNPSGNMVQHNREQIEAAGVGSKLVLRVYDVMSPHSAFVRRFLNPFKPSYLAVTLSTSLLRQLENEYFTTIVEANEYAKSKGALFYHFLQPNLYTVQRRTSYEERLLQNGYIVPRGLEKIYLEGYSVLRNATQRATARGILSADLSAVFDRRKSEIFFDFCHVNEVGNEFLALEILVRIATYLHDSAIAAKSGP